MSNEPTIEAKMIDEGYIIYPDSRVMGKKGRFLRLKVGAAGYVILNTWCNYQQKTYSLHRLVATLFVPNPLNLPEVNHDDGNKLNNHYTNLKWVTRSENIEHAYATGLNPGTWTGKTGAKHFKSKAVLQLKGGVIIGKFGSIREAGRETGIDSKHINDVVLGRGITAGGFNWQYAQQLIKSNKQSTTTNEQA